MTNIPYKLSSLIILPVFLISSPVFAQSIWSMGETPSEISAQYMRPTFEDGLLSTLSGFTVILSGRGAISETKTILIRIPYFEGTWTPGSSFGVPLGPTTHTAVGNIFVGMESAREEKKWSLLYGLYLPTLSEKKMYAALVATITDVDQSESAIPNTFTPVFRINYRSKQGLGLGVIARFGVSGMINTKSTSSNSENFEAYLNYAVQPIFNSEHLHVIAGVSGKLIMTEPGNLEDKVLHQFGISVEFPIKNFRIGAFGRLPLNDNLSLFLKNTYGFTGAVTI